MNRLVASITCIGLLLANITTSYAENQSNLTTINIGVIAPLSGRTAAVGQAVKNSIILQSEHQRMDNSITSPTQIKFIFEDDQFDPKQSVSAARKLIEVNKVKGLIVFGSGPAIASADMAERNQIPMFAMGFSDNIITNKKYIFKCFSSATQQANTLAQEIHRNRYSTVALLAATNEANTTVRDRLHAQIATKVVFNKEITPEDVDLKTLALQIKQINPQAVSLLLVPPQMSIMAKRLIENGYTGTLFGTSTLSNPNEIAASQGALNGAWLTVIDDSKSTGFKKEYIDRFNTNPISDSSVAYDIAALFWKYQSSAELIAALDNADSFNGIFGTWKKVSYHSFEPPVVINSIKEGELNPLPALSK